MGNYMLAILTIGTFLVNANLNTGFDTLSDRIDLIISPIDYDISYMRSEVKRGLEQIYDRIGMMKLY